jgi:hypothetical protein
LRFAKHLSLSKKTVKTGLFFDKLGQLFSTEKMTALFFCLQAELGKEEK